MKRALITGITGQDGSYLAEYLLLQGYEVHGVSRRVAVDGDKRLWRLNKSVLSQVKLHSAAIEHYPSVRRVIEAIQPDECYHLAAQSFVADSFKDEFTTMRVNVDGTHNMLSVLRDVVPSCKFYFAGSSEMFGEVLADPQDERTPFNPRSVYGISKCAGFYMTQHYRHANGMHASNGILFNHEGPRRNSEFVTRKIARAVARISAGLDHEVRLGNLDAMRDWGHAKDYVRAMHMMLQREAADDYVIATGESHSVREFCVRAFSYVGLDWEQHVKIDPEFFRPTDVNTLRGNAIKAYKVLGWAPKVTFQHLVEEMVQSELDFLK